jgi:amidophosphoribosyltransferase
LTGLVGILAFDKIWNVTPFIKYSLIGLQHRGYRITGVATLNDNVIKIKIDNVSPEDFTPEGLKGWTGIGFASSKASIARYENNVLIYDGYLRNPEEEIRKIKKDYEKAFSELKGVGSLIYLDSSGFLLAYRDEIGLKPLWLGGFGFDMAIIASEPVAMNVIGAEPKREIDAGELVIIDPYNIEIKRVTEPKIAHCTIEYIYQARIDSVIHSKSVYELRVKIGEQLARERPIDADVVIGVPETAIPFAVGYARTLGLRFDLGFARSGSTIRTMLASDDFMKIIGAQLKLNPIESVITNKRIILIDDSMVTGTTLKLTAFMLRKLGAREIHVLIGSPKLISNCPYGVEIPDEKNLIAANLNETEIIRELGIDSIYWLSLEGLFKVIGHKNLCLGCMTKMFPKVIS